MKIIRFSFFVLAMTIVVSTYLFAQDYKLQRQKDISFSLYPRIGVAGNYHSANFVFFKGMADCGTVESSFGIGFTAGIAIEKHISLKSAFSLGFNYVNRGIQFNNENKYPMRNIDGTLTNVITNTSLDVSLSFFEIQPDFRFLISDDLFGGAFRTVAGIRMLLPLTNSFEQSEHIVTPSSAVFLSTQTQNRLLASGDIHSIGGFWFGLCFGFENQIELSKNYRFSQQLLLDYNFGNLCTDADWKILGFRLEIGFPICLSSKPEKTQLSPKEQKPPLMN